jgi:hypothetical protein
MTTTVFSLIAAFCLAGAGFLFADLALVVAADLIAWAKDTFVIDLED